MPFNLGKPRKTEQSKPSAAPAQPAIAQQAAAMGNGKGAPPTQDDLASLFSRAASADIDMNLVKQLTKAVKRSLKISRKGITVSGQGLAELLLKIAPRIPVSSYDELSARSKGMSGESLGGYTVKRASRHSAAIGGLAGGLASAGAFAPPTWILLPAEILVETILIAAVEMKLVAELHVVYGRPIEGTSEERGQQILEAWSERRGIRLDKLATDGLAHGGAKGARSQLVHLIRRKLIARAARNISTVAPMLIGAAAAAEINRRATRDLGDAIVRDLGKQRASAIETRLANAKPNAASTTTVSTKKDPN